MGGGGGTHIRVMGRTESVLAGSQQNRAGKEQFREEVREYLALLVIVGAAEI